MIIGVSKHKNKKRNPKSYTSKEKTKYKNIMKKIISLILIFTVCFCSAQTKSVKKKTTIPAKPSSMSFVATLDSVNISFGESSEADIQVYLKYFFTNENKKVISVNDERDNEYINFEYQSNPQSFIALDHKFVDWGYQNNDFTCTLKPEYKGKKCKVIFENVWKRKVIKSIKKIAPPEATAENYLKAIKRQNFDYARALATEESKTAIDYMAKMANTESEEVKKAASEAKIEIMDMTCITKGNVSDCTCKVYDGKKEEVANLHLIKIFNEIWAVELKKKVKSQKIK
jgi:hypothetical protein